MSSIRERLATVETRLQDFLRRLNEMQESNKKSHSALFSKLETLEDTVMVIDSNLKIVQRVVSNLNPKMSRKEKSAVIIALISSVTAIVIALIQAISG